MERFKVSVKVNNDAFFIWLPKAATLTGIRDILSERHGIKMGRKAYFICLKKNGSPKIPLCEEKDICIEDVIDAEKTLEIKGELEPNWADIIEKNSLECGLFFTDEGLKCSARKAFKIIKHPKDTLRRPITSDQEVICKTEIDNISVKNLFVTTNLCVNLPYVPISAKLGGAYQSNFIDHYNKKKFETYYKSIRIHAIFPMSELEVEPTEEFISAVDEALNSKNCRNSLEQVTKEFGQFWCKKLGIGGCILYVKKGGSNSYEIDNDKNKEGFINSCIGGSVGRGRNQRIAETNEYTHAYFQCRGGLEKNYHEHGMSGWITSLEDYKTWEVAAISDVHSIFDILDEERRIKVAMKLKKRIIYSKVEKLEFRMDISKSKPHVYKIPVEYNLSNYQIFVTEMKDDNSDTIFASRVHYISDKDQPVILLHRLGSLNKTPKYQIFSINLGWIVLGTSTMLNLLEQKLDFESGESQITTKNEYCSAIIPSRLLNPNESLLATCVSRSTNLQEDYATSKYVTRSHFVYNDKNGVIKACAFCYDLERKELVYQLDGLNTKFSINYSIITGVETKKFGQAQIKRQRGKEGIHKKRFEIEFDKSQQMSLSCPQSPFFVNLVLDKCPKSCPHGVFNITTTYAEFKFINSDYLGSSLKNKQIAYFLV
ncbi:2783_t:CDS:2 [Ambispora leptoticha]|uniref:2783_t:CDS:1 n=1 Tax=Ambispora leptoticha TaxID=144679 RepID=A0A9N9AED2_9GLOM|nr:2783_t:CDS:2 [Ambispora leptoticha]